VFMMNLDDKEYQHHTKPMMSHVNIGTGVDVTIGELAEIVRNIVGFKGKIVWDRSKPDGTLRKLLDVSLIEHIGWRSAISLENGIRHAYQAYKNSEK